jgi:fibronectin-binding autotransporter adhesin
MNPQSSIHEAIRSRQSWLGLSSTLPITAAAVLLLASPPVRADDFTWNGGDGTWPSPNWTNVTMNTSDVAGPTTAGNSGTISSGSVTFATSDSLGDASSTASPAITLNTGAALSSAENFTKIWDLNLAGGTLLSDGGIDTDFQAFQLAGILSVTGSQASTIGVAAPGLNSFNAISVGSVNNSTLTLDVSDVTGNANADLTIAAVLKNPFSVAGNLTKSGAGTAVLSAANTYSGNTTVSAGVLTLGTSASLSNSQAITVASGATLNLFGTNNNQIQNGYTRDTANAASLAISGTMNVGSAIQTMYASSISMTNGTINFTNANGYLWMPARTITFNGANNAVTGSISNGGIFAGLNGTTLTLATPLANDVVAISANLAATGNANFTKSGLGVLRLEGTANNQIKSGFNGIWTVSGTLAVAGTTANTVYGSGITLNNGTLASLGAGNGLGSFFVNKPMTITANGADNQITGNQVLGIDNTLTMNTPLAADVLTVSGTMVMGGGLIKSGSGTLELANTYSGNTTVSAGVLTLGTSASLSNSQAITVASGATLNLFGTNNNQIQNGFTRDTANAASLAISGTMNVGSAIHTMYASSISMTNGTINFTNANGFLWMPARTITFNGANNAVTGSISNGGIFAGLYGTTLTLATPLANDVVAISANLAATGNANFTKSGLGVLRLEGTANNQIKGGFNGIWTVSGTLAVAGTTANTVYGSGITLNNGTLASLGAGISIGSFFVNQPMTITANGADNQITGNQVLGINNTLTMNTPLAADVLTVSGTMVMGGGLIKSGSGTLELAGANSGYTGAITVNAGTVALSGAGSIVTSSGVNLAAEGATFSISAASGGRTIAGLTGVAGSVVELGINTLTTNGTVTLEPGAVFAAQIDSAATTAGQIFANNDVTLTGASLSLTDIAATPASIPAGTKLTLIDYDTLTLTGTFAGLPEGSTVAAGINSFTLSYADDGMVTLTAFESSDPFATWAAGAGLDGSPGKEAGFNDDPDGDGVANGLEWILGGNPLDGKSGSLVTATATASGGLTLSFSRNEDAVGNATLTVEYNSTLANPWNSATIGATSSGPDDNGVTVTIDTDATPDTVTVNIPASNATAEKLFGRLKATQP